MALAEYSIGKGFRAGRFHGSIKRDGDGGLQLHSDQSWIPAPFPEHNLLVTFCFACEGMTEEGGATIVVPRSHLLRRHPTEAEIAESPTVAIEVEKGDVAVWDGATWHGAGSRSIPGTRTMLHATYQRLYTQPIDDFTHLLEDEEYLANAPDGMLDLLGTDLFFGTGSLNVDIDMEKFARTAAKSRL
jgi:ectoine hydroxylase-related dioxygenase (phytanoyl-CoA dioxygenase family)